MNDEMNLSRSENGAWSKLTLTRKFQNPERDITTSVHQNHQTKSQKNTCHWSLFVSQKLTIFHNNTDMDKNSSTTYLNLIASNPSEGTSQGSACRKNSKSSSGLSSFRPEPSKPRRQEDRPLGGDDEWHTVVKKGP